MSRFIFNGLYIITNSNAFVKRLRREKCDIIFTFTLAYIVKIKHKYNSADGFPKNGGIMRKQH